MSWRDLLPEDNDPHWMSQLPSGSDALGVPAFGVHNPTLAEIHASSAEQAGSVAGQYAGHTAVQAEIAEVSPLLRSEMPPHHWGEHPAELRDKLMQAGLAARAGEALSGRPERSSAVNHVYDLFAALAEHCKQNGAHAMVSVADLMNRTGLAGEERFAAARLYNIANSRRDQRNQ